MSLFSGKPSNFPIPPHPKPKFSPNHIEEIRKCANEPAHFVRSYVKIKHPVKGTIPFDMFPKQEKFLQSLKDNRFNITNKSRQIGITTIVAAFILWFIWFHKDKNVLIVSKSREDSASVLKKIKEMIVKMPQFIQKMTYVDVDNVFSLELHNGSKITCLASTKKSGRSESVSLLFIDEAALIDGLEEMWTAIKPTVSTGGNIIIASTPVGVFNMFHDMCKDAMNCGADGVGINDFVYTELPYNSRPDFDEEWFKKETAGMGPKRISQEYLCQFLGSGDTVLDAETLVKIGEEVRLIKFVREDEKFPRVKIYREYNPNSLYIITGDTSRGDAEDFTGLVVWEIVDKENIYEAVTYKDKIPYDITVDIVEKLYTDYHNPLIVIESNYYGAVVIGELYKRGCDNIYYSKVQNEDGKTVEEKMKKVPGFTTSSKSRDMAISIWERMFRERKVHLSSKLTYDEFTTFIWKRNAISVKAEAQKGAHDDLVICSAIACYIIGLEYDKLLSSVDDLTKLYAGMMVSTTNSSGHHTVMNAKGNVVENDVQKRIDILETNDKYSRLSEAMNGNSDCPVEIKRMRTAYKQQKELEDMFGIGIFKG